MDELNKRALLKRAIYLCWLLLGLSLLIKLFGGNFFEPYTDNEKFLTLCEFIDTNILANAVLGILLSFSSMTLFWLATAHQRWYKSRKELIICAVTVLIGSPCRLLIPVTGIFFDTVYYFVVPYFVILGRSSFRRVLCSFGVLVAFMVLCNVIKNVPMPSLISDNTVTTIIYMVDLYIMLSLYYLYSSAESDGDQDGLGDGSMAGVNPKTNCLQCATSVCRKALSLLHARGKTLISRQGQAAFGLLVFSFCGKIIELDWTKSPVFTT